MSTPHLSRYRLGTTVEGAYAVFFYGPHVKMARTGLFRREPIETVGWHLISVLFKTKQEACRFAELDWFARTGERATMTVSQTTQNKEQ